MMKRAPLLPPLSFVVFLFAGVAGCGGADVQAVARWEAEGDIPSLRRALTDRQAAVRGAAAQVLVRYAAYQTSRPAMLATLERAGTAEARAAASQLYGRPPLPSPDPDGAAAMDPRRASAAVIYFYRPAEDPGPALWLQVDGAPVARLGPGQYYRYETDVGQHPLRATRQGQEGDPDDVLKLIVSTPAPGAYYVRHLVRGLQGKLAFDVMPVPPALAALRRGHPVDESAITDSERARMRRRRE